MSNHILFTIALLFSLFTVSSNASKTLEVAKKSPNIIFILADDLSYMDVNGFAEKVTGTPIHAMYYETPNIDRLMKEEISFSQACVCQLCAPTRASLLIGKSAAKIGFTTAMGHTKTSGNTKAERI